MLPGLPDARDRAWCLTATGAEMSAHAHRSNRSPERLQLYEQVRSTYVKLGGELGVSRPKQDAFKKEPMGPRSDFSKRCSGL